MSLSRETVQRALAVLTVGGLLLLLTASAWLEAGFDGPLPLLLGVGLGTMLLTAALSLRLRVWLLEAPRFRKAEALWHGGAAPEAILPLLDNLPLARGELGFRWALLRGAAHLAAGQRDAAWWAYTEAHLRRIPIWRRGQAARFLRSPNPQPTEADLRRVAGLVRALPHSGRLRHLLGVLELRRGGPGAEDRAWGHFAEAVPSLWMDPLVLEDIFQAALGRPERLPVAELALNALRRHHGDPSIPWDRAGAARHLLDHNRPAEATALLLGIPEPLRTQPWHWAGLAMALRQCGDAEGARQVLDRGLQSFPNAFRLWMERFRQALEDGQDGLAEECLTQARRCLPPGGEGLETHLEWKVRRAEFEHWVRGDAEAARKLLEEVPQAWHGDHHPPLRLQVLVSQGDYEEAQRQLAPLLEQHPEDVDLLLLQADILAGLEAWKALPPFLDPLPEIARSRAIFWHLRGLALIHLGQPLESRMDLERAASMEPGTLRYVLDAGHACAELGEWERSEMHWRQALRLDARNEEALIHLADARRAQHDEAASRALLRECLLHHPRSEDAQTRLAELEAQ